MYDLTSFLTTISAGSASFVAILGGLIAQKVIEISNERSAIEEDLKEFSEQKELRQKDIEKYDRWIEEDDAICFIGRRAKELLNEQPFSVAIDAEDLDGDEDLPTLERYWNKALQILRMYADTEGLSHFETVRKIRKEIDNIEPSDEDELTFPTDSDFVKCVCEIIKDHFEAYYKNDGFNSRGQAFITPALLNADRYGASGVEYHQWLNDRNKVVGEVSALELRIIQSEDRKKRLKVPDELKSGFWVFGAFIAFCVLLPLVLTPFTTESLVAYIIVKVLFLLIFGGGLFSVLLYIKRLLPK